MIEHDGCVGCKYEHEDEASPHCDKCTQNSTDKYTPASNADRIRSMSDKELAVFFAKVNAALCRADLPIIAYRGETVNDNLDWLWQPAETEGAK